MRLADAQSIDQIRRQGRIDPDQIAALRSTFYDTDVIAESDAEALLAVTRTIQPRDPVWAEFVIEAVTEHIVNDADPRGYLNAANARWIASRIAPEGWISSRTELDLLINVLDKARWAPDSLAVLALSTVRHAVAAAGGPLRSDAAVPAGRITDADVAATRRILVAAGGERPVAITRANADVLFDVQEAIADNDHPAWDGLFALAVVNVAHAIAGYSVPSRKEALAMQPTSVGNEAGAGCLELGMEELALARLERQRIEIITGETQAEPDAAWLTARLERCGNRSSAIAAVRLAAQRLPARVGALLAPSAPNRT